MLEVGVGSPRVRVTIRATKYIYPQSLIYTHTTPFSDESITLGLLGLPTNS